MDIAIKLFSAYNFESVSVRQIALESGIKPSSIYNHYKSKQDILNHIYIYFKENVFISRKTLSEMKILICKLEPLEFLDHLHFKFNTQGKKMYVRMSLIMKIVYTRIFIDEQAKNIFDNILGKDCVRYSKEILDYGISIGRIDSIDTYTFSSCLNGQLHMMGIRAFTDPNHKASELTEQKKILELYASMLKFNEI